MNFLTWAGPFQKLRAFLLLNSLGSAAAPIKVFTSKSMFLSKQESWRLKSSTITSTMKASSQSSNLFSPTREKKRLTRFIWQFKMRISLDSSSKDSIFPFCLDKPNVRKWRLRYPYSNLIKIIPIIGNAWINRSSYTRLALHFESCAQSLSSTSIESQISIT